jgi:hypothetical protein
MPLLVSSIESRAMSEEVSAPVFQTEVILGSGLVHARPEGKTKRSPRGELTSLQLRESTYLTTITTAGGQPITLAQIRVHKFTEKCGVYVIEGEGCCC